jgi:uncharacterized membrane protein YiaA
MSFVLSLFAAVTVQKNVRDLGGSISEGSVFEEERDQENSAL